MTNTIEVIVPATPTTIEVTVAPSGDPIAVDVIQQSIEVAIGGAVGPPGIEGPIGPTGLVKVDHGADPNVARPSATLVYWVGSVAPVNATTNDLWYQT